VTLRKVVMERSSRETSPTPRPRTARERACGRWSRILELGAPPSRGYLEERRLLAQPSGGHRPPRWNSLWRSAPCPAAAR